MRRGAKKDSERPRRLIPLQQSGDYGQIRNDQSIDSARRSSLSVARFRLRLLPGVFTWIRRPDNGASELNETTINDSTAVDHRARPQAPLWQARRVSRVVTNVGSAPSFNTSCCLAIWYDLAQREAEDAQAI
jgi:hypothetical protein